MLTKSKLAIELSKLQDFDEHILHLEQYSTPSEIAADIVWKAYMLGDVKGKVILDPACGPGFLGIGCLLLGAKEVYFLDVDEKIISILKNNLMKLKIDKNKYEIMNKDIKDFNKDNFNINHKITKIDGHSVGFSPQYLTRRFLGLKIVGLKSEVLNRQFSINKNNNDKKFNINKKISYKINKNIINNRIQVVIQNPPFGTKRKYADGVFLEKAFEISDVIYSFHKIESKDFIEKIAQDNRFKITHYWEYDFELKATQRFHRRRIHRIRVGCWRIERL